MTIQRRAIQRPENVDDATLSATKPDTLTHQQIQQQHEEDEYAHQKQEKLKKKYQHAHRKGVDGTAITTTTTTSTSIVYDILRLILSLFVVSCALSYFVMGDGLFWGYRPWYTRMNVVRAWIVRLFYFPFAFNPL